MSNSTPSVKLFCAGLVAFLALVLAAAPRAGAVINCSVIYSNLAPCLGYVSGGALSPRCCPIIRSLSNQIRTKPDRQSACGCLKNLATSYPSRVGRAQALIKLCGVSLPFGFGPKVDCSKVN